MIRSFTPPPPQLYPEIVTDVTLTVTRSLSQFFENRKMPRLKNATGTYKRPKKRAHSKDPIKQIPDTDVDVVHDHDVQNQPQPASHCHLKAPIIDSVARGSAVDVDVENFDTPSKILEPAKSHDVIHTRDCFVLLEKADRLCKRLQIGKSLVVDDENSCDSLSSTESAQSAPSTATAVSIISTSGSEPLFTEVQVQVPIRLERGHNGDLLNDTDRTLECTADDRKMEIGLWEEAVSRPKTKAKRPHKAPANSTGSEEDPQYAFVKEIFEKLDREFNEEQAADKDTYWETNLNVILNSTATFKKIDATKPVRAIISRTEQPVIEPPEITPRLTATIKISRKGKKIETQNVQVTMIKPVNPLPSSNYWTQIPHNVRLEEDAKELSHYPNLDNIKIKPANQAKFEEELFKAYGKKFHGNLSESNKIDDELFMRLVKSVESDDRLRSSGAMSTETSENQELWTALSKSIDGGLTETELKNRYDAIKRRKNPPKASQNVDNSSTTYSVNQSKDVTMQSYTALFCRRCFIYDCLKHNENDHLDVKSYLERKTPASPGKEIKQRHKEHDLITCNNYANCWRKRNTFVREKDKVMAEWTANEEVMLRCLLDSFRDEYCLISNTLMTKSCQQVYELAIIMKSEQDDGYASQKVSSFNLEVSLTPSKRKADIKTDIEPNPYKNMYLSHIIPCKHSNDMPCHKENPDCSCGKNGTACEKYCFCPDNCLSRFQGCKCDGKESCGSNKLCPCFKCGRECDPELCIPCGANEHNPQSPGCGNVSLQRGYQQNLLRVRESKIHQGGWGLFTFSVIKKGNLIVEYRGELISHDEAERRGMIYDMRLHTFLFALNDRFVLDSTRYGNIARFINSSKKPNGVAKYMLVNGDNRIGIYALKDISVGEEIVFDYHHVIKKKHKKNKKQDSKSAT